jgi:hypothetical protein
VDLQEPEAGNYHGNKKDNEQGGCISPPLERDQLTGIDPFYFCQ